jgi:hypothetical protein
MQRWIYIGLAACLLIGSTMVFFFMKMRGNRPDSRWVPIAMRSGISAEQKSEIVSTIEKFVKDDKLIQEVSAEVNLQNQLGVATAEEAKIWLAKAAFVRIGKQQDPATMQDLETIDIGVSGKRKESDALGASATKLGEKVRKMLDEAVKK